MRLQPSRRRFLRSCFQVAASAAAWRLFGSPAGAIEAFDRKGPPRLLPALAAYSFRNYFVTASHTRETVPEPPRRIDLFDFVDFCATHGCAAELTSYYFPPNTDADYLLKLRRHAFLRGVPISGTAVGNTFTLPEGQKRDEQIAMVNRWIENAAILGAPHVRIFAGAAGGLSKAEAKKQCIAAVEQCAEVAAPKGVFLGLENHGGIVAAADDLLDIIHALKSPWVGINLDSGNFHTDDPYRDMERCAPYAVNVQIKSELRPRGKKTEEADWDRMMKILRDANYQGYVALEYEAAPDPWETVPGLLKRLKALAGSSTE